MILVIVDMQPYFRTSQDARVLNGVIEQVKLARKNDWPIVVVEYMLDAAEEANTDARIMEALVGYEKWVGVLKNADNGAPEVLEACYKREWPTTHFRVCGVNTEFCVRSTAEGLSAVQYSFVEVVATACNHKYWPGNPWQGENAPANIMWREAA